MTPHAKTIIIVTIIIFILCINFYSYYKTTIDPKEYITPSSHKFREVYARPESPKTFDELKKNNSTEVPGL
jgi:uncharacterized protein YpmB